MRLLVVQHVIGCILPPCERHQFYANFDTALGDAARHVQITKMETNWLMSRDVFVHIGQTSKTSKLHPSIKPARWAAAMLQVC
jgi:hypothetical protein